MGWWRVKKWQRLLQMWYNLSQTFFDKGRTKSLQQKFQQFCELFIFSTQISPSLFYFAKKTLPQNSIFIHVFISLQNIIISLIIYLQKPPSPMTEINERTHKLLILAGDESPALQARDFKKLQEVIINQYLAGKKPAFEQFLVQILTSVIRRVPLKQHIYAGLTNQINKLNEPLSITILKKVVQNLEKDLNTLKVHQSINGILFLSELMNLQKLNSQCFFDVIDDIVTSIENCKNPNHRAFFVLVFSRTLHNFCYSLNKKVYFEFKKLLERAKKYCHKNIQFCTILQHFQKGTINDGSIVNRIYETPASVSSAAQIQQKIRLIIQISEEQKYVAIQYHLPPTTESDKLYQEYQKNEGQLHLTNMQQIVQLMRQYSTFMLEKLNNYVNYESEKNSFMKRFFVDLVFGKGIKSTNTIVESFLLVKMVKSGGLYADLVEGVLKRGFADIDALDLSEQMKFAQIVSYVAYNWPTSNSDMTDIGLWDWEKFVRNSEDQLLGQQQISLTPKKVVLLKIIFSKIMLLNENSKIPGSLKKYCPAQDLKNPVKYKGVEQLEVLQSFQQYLKKKLNSEEMLEHIKNQSDYEIFLEALFEKTSQSHTHLEVLISRYERVFLKYKEDCDWTLLNSVRSYWSKSLFHRLLYLSAIIERGYVDFESYVKYISKVDSSNQEEAHLVKIQLNQLLKSFGEKLKSSV